MCDDMRFGDDSRGVAYAKGKEGALLGDAMDDTLDDGEAIARLNLLRIEHRDLDAAIVALAAGGVPDQLQMMRLKKRKLRLRDEIAALEDQLIPDIIA